MIFVTIQWLKQVIEPWVIMNRGYTLTMRGALAVSGQGQGYTGLCQQSKCDVVNNNFGADTQNFTVKLIIVPRHCFSYIISLLLYLRWPLPSTLGFNEMLEVCSVEKKWKKGVSKNSIHNCLCILEAKWNLDHLYQHFQM